MKKTSLCTAIVAAAGLSWGAGAQADSIVQIDPNGIVGGINPYSVSVLDWNVGNALSVADPGSNVNGPPTVGMTFQTYAQASLGSFNDANGDSITGTCLGTCEWTFVVGFREQFTSVTGGGTAGGTAEFASITGGTNFFEIWYQSPRNSDMLAGTGFNDTNLGSGAPILTGVILPSGVASVGGFTRSSGANAGGLTNPLDAFGIDNYFGVGSINGNGSTRLTIEVKSVDPAFFLGGAALVGSRFNMNFSTQQTLNFIATNPSAAFVFGPGGVAPVPGSGAPSVGPCNGCTAAEGGTMPDRVMFQADASNSFTVPEPDSVALLGIGALGMGLASLRRRKLSS